MLTKISDSMYIDLDEVAGVLRETGVATATRKPNIYYTVLFKNGQKWSIPEKHTYKFLAFLNTILKVSPDGGWIEMEPTDENIKLVADYTGDSEKYVRELLDMDHRLVSKRSEIDGEMMYSTDLGEEVM